MGSRERRSSGCHRRHRQQQPRRDHGERISGHLIYQDTYKFRTPYLHTRTTLFRTDYHSGLYGLFRLPSCEAVRYSPFYNGSDYWATVVSPGTTNRVLGHCRHWTRSTRRSRVTLMPRITGLHSWRPSPRSSLTTSITTPTTSTPGCR